MISPTCPEVAAGGGTPSTARSQTVLVTDATGEVGRELAREFARHRVALVLVAPDESQLAALALRLRADFRVEVLAIVSDLGSHDAAGKIAHEVTAAGLKLTIIATHIGIFARTA